MTKEEVERAIKEQNEGISHDHQSDYSKEQLTTSINE